MKEDLSDITAYKNWLDAQAEPFGEEVGGLDLGRAVARHVDVQTSAGRTPGARGPVGREAGGEGRGLRRAGEGADEVSRRVLQAARLGGS